MNSYQAEQLAALELVRSFLADQSAAQIRRLHQKIAPYLYFRQTLDDFLARFFSRMCTDSCYQSRRSACCSKDGIITFFADLLINIVFSDSAQVNCLEQAIRHPASAMKCIYLGAAGCTWQIKPLVCVMFLCDPAQTSVFEKNPQAASAWQALKLQERSFRWPDRPVLFDWLEQSAIDGGHYSPLMYLHNSPGLLRVKKRAGLI